MPKNINTDITLNDDLKFLIACCQNTPSEADTAFILSHLSQNEPSSSSPTPEPRTLNPLIALANQHGILPLVYKTIKNLSENTSPRSLSLSKCSSIQHSKSNIQHFLSELKPIYMSIVQKNMLMTSELLKIMSLLKENKVEALAFKGPTLAQMAYGDITLRQYGDLDILVDEQDAYRAAELMIQHAHEAILPLSIVSSKTCLHVAKDFSLLSKTGVHTELHWRLFEKKYNISLLSCAKEQKCQSVTINGNTIKTLQNELLLVYLCLHGAKHAFERIEWICDIDRLILTSTVDWDYAISLAEQSHSKRSFYLGLSLAHTLLQTMIPETIHNIIQKEDIQILQKMTLVKMRNRKEHSDFEKNKETFAYQSKLFDTKADMLRFWLSTFFKISTNDCQTFTLPENLKFLYIFLRPVRLIYSYTHRLFATRST